MNAANASSLARTLSIEHDKALLFRTLATLRTDICLFDDVECVQRRAMVRRRLELFKDTRARSRPHRY